MKKRLLIGVDPGVDTFSLAIYDCDRKRMLEHWTGSAWQGIQAVVKHFGLLQHEAIVFLEDPDSSTHIVGGFRNIESAARGHCARRITLQQFIATTKTQLEVARSVGMVSVIGRIAGQVWNQAGLKVVGIPPNTRMCRDNRKYKQLPVRSMIMPTKLNAQEYKEFTGWLGATNPDKRDAGTLVFGCTWPHAQLLLAKQAYIPKSQFSKPPIFQL